MEHLTILMTKHLSNSSVLYETTGHLLVTWTNPPKGVKLQRCGSTPQWQSCSARAFSKPWGLQQERRRFLLGTTLGLFFFETFWNSFETTCVECTMSQKTHLQNWCLSCDDFQEPLPISTGPAWTWSIGLPVLGHPRGQKVNSLADMFRDTNLSGWFGTKTEETKSVGASVKWCHHVFFFPLLFVAPTSPPAFSPFSHLTAWAATALPPCFRHGPDRHKKRSGGKAGERYTKWMSQDQFSQVFWLVWILVLFKVIVSRFVCQIRLWHSRNSQMFGPIYTATNCGFPNESFLVISFALQLAASLWNIWWWSLTAKKTTGQIVLFPTGQVWWHTAMVENTFARHFRAIVHILTAWLTFFGPGEKSWEKSSLVKNLMEPKSRGSKFGQYGGLSHNVITMDFDILTLGSLTSTRTSRKKPGPWRLPNCEGNRRKPGEAESISNLLSLVSWIICPQ